MSDAAADEVLALPRQALAAALAATPLANRADALVGLAEPFVRLDVPPPADGPLAAFWRRATENDEWGDYAAAEVEQSAWLRDTLPLGANRTGGTPDLPPGLAWPAERGRKLMFLAQVDLTTVPQWAGSPLPTDGWLYFFLFATNLADEPFEPWQARVLHHRGDRDALVRAAEPAPADVWMAPQDEAGAFHFVSTVPRLGLHVDANRLAAELPDVDVYDVGQVTDAVFPATQSTGGSSWDHSGYLLGSTPDVDGTPTEMVAGGVRAGYPPAEGDDWINLFAFSPAGSIDWGDMFALYFLIRPAALASGDFADVRTGAGCA